VVSRREKRLDDALARRRAHREHVDLDSDAAERMRRAREALGLPHTITEGNPA